MSDSASHDTEAKDAVHVLAQGPQKPINEVKRFSLLTMGFYGSMCCSFGYAFNIISGAMQTRYNLSMTDLSTIISVGSAIGYFMIPWGVLYDLFGPMPLTFPAVTMLLIGQICLALSFTGTIKANTARLTVFNVLVSIGITMYEMLNSLTVIGHFPVDKGAVVGLMKTFTGLGTALFGTIQLGFFDQKPDRYLYFLAAFGVATGVPLCLFMRHAPYVLTIYQTKHMAPEKQEEKLATKAQYMRQRPPMAVFVYAFILLWVFIIYLPVQSCLVNYIPLGKTYRLAFAIVTVILLSMGLLVIPLTYLLTRNRKQQQQQPEGEDELGQITGEAEPTYEKPVEVVAAQVFEGAEETAPKKKVETEIDYLAPQYQTKFLRSILTLRLWALFWTIFVSIGPELSITYNATYMYIALAEAPQPDSTRILLSVLNGSGSAIGRLAMAFLENWSQKKKAEERIPITFVLFIPTATVILALIFFLSLPAAVLPLAFTINSFGNGFLNSAMVLVSRTLYAKDAAKHYHVCFCATSIAVLIFTRALFAEWYAKEAFRIGGAKAKVCMKKSCVRVPNIIMLCFTCSGLLSGLYLHLRYVAYCRKVLAERARIMEETAGSSETLPENVDYANKDQMPAEVQVGRELSDVLSDKKN